MISFTTTLVALLSSAGPAGPSFDCHRASTRIEKTICSTPALAALDLELADTYRTALAASPADHASLKDSQVAWLRHRDRTCGDRNAAFLAYLYRARIAELVEPPDRQALSLCRAIAARARLAGGESHVELVPTAKPVPAPDEPTLAGWDAWGHRQQPPFRFEAVPLSDDPLSNATAIHQLPGAQWYAAARIVGTAHCWQMAFFRNERGRAVLAEGPPAWTSGDETSSCGAVRGFGTVDGVAVAVETWSSPYDLEERITLARWDGVRFGAPCELRLDYRPTFGSPSSNVHRESCGTSGCGPLRDAAAGVVAEIYGLGAERIDGPFRRKRTIDGVAYSVSASRATIGWRVLSAWEVTFERADGKGEARTVVVDVNRGPLREVRVW